MRDERGSTTLEMAIVAPALMVLLLGILQFGLVQHAQQVARTAAQEAARSAAAESANPEVGRDRAVEVMSAGLGNLIGEPEVKVEKDPDLVRAQVRATLRGVLPIPGLSTFNLSGAASVYSERFRPAGDES
jgi:type II secretory pathway pseudopilin PulG